MEYLTSLEVTMDLSTQVQAFTEFAAKWGFQHKTSSPHHPASNGFAESMVEIVKTAFTKANYSGKDPQLALLALHSTPVDPHLPSPAQCYSNIS